MSEDQNSGAENFETGGESSPFLTAVVAVLLAAHFARASLPDVDMSWFPLRSPAVANTNSPIPFLRR
ncbi:MAG: hypothetical protein KBC88_07705 [Alphaproteobacteria bacterium]|jgi:hypothetical protein|nr:hypothetical protein [Alphaproteobacteria bacterium]MBP9868796.1 hypothetical protein [Alphaproteobacteria bacterium]